jgi:hypothetical protein
MFGKPEWFRRRTCGWALRPIAWQGWLYTIVWGLVIALPFCALAMWGRAPEAAVWLVVTGGGLVWDVRQIGAAIQRKENPPDIEFLDESHRRQSTLTTRDFRMHLDR